MREDPRRRATPVRGVRRRPETLEPDPVGGALVADEVAPTAGARLVSLGRPPVRDRAGPRDQHDAAAQRVPCVERGLGVVRHLDPGRGRDQPGEDLAAALAIFGAVASGAGEHDRVGSPSRERPGQRGRDGALRVGGGEEVCAAARAAAEQISLWTDGEGARLRRARVDTDGEAAHARSMRPDLKAGTAHPR